MTTKACIAILGVLLVCFTGGQAVVPVAPEVKDDGKFFSPEAIRKANRSIREIARKYDRDVLVETFAKVPGDDVDRVKAMSSSERAKFFHNWATDRAEAAVVHGVYVLICREPATLSVHITERARNVIDMRAHEQLREQLLKAFREKRYDEGLQGAVDFVRERFEAAARK